MGNAASVRLPASPSGESKVPSTSLIGQNEEKAEYSKDNHGLPQDVSSVKKNEVYKSFPIDSLSSHQRHEIEATTIVSQRLNTDIEKLSTRSNKHRQSFTPNSSSRSRKRSSKKDNSKREKDTGSSTTVMMDAAGQGSKGLTSIRSLRQMAVKHHSRQENVYIPNYVVISSASFLAKRNNNISTTKTSTTNGVEDTAMYRKHNKTLAPLNIYDDDNNNIQTTNNILSDGLLAGIDEQNESVESSRISSPVHMPTKTITKSIRPNLKIKVQDDNIDDCDWIQVVDEDDEINISDDDDEDGNISSSRRNNMTNNQQRMEESKHEHESRNRRIVNEMNHKRLNPKSSFLFTQSGTILVNGFQQGRISVAGIQQSHMDSDTASTTASNSSYQRKVNAANIKGSIADVNATNNESNDGHSNNGQLNNNYTNNNNNNDNGGNSTSTTKRVQKLAMSDRVLLLCRLGQGASSVVYKALDLQTMQLVAVKMISFYERGKRRQMVRELTTLFQLLRQKEQQPSSSFLHHTHTHPLRSNRPSPFHSQSRLTTVSSTDSIHTMTKTINNGNNNNNNNNDKSFDSRDDDVSGEGKSNGWNGVVSNQRKLLNASVASDISEEIMPYPQPVQQQSDCQPHNTKCLVDEAINDATNDVHDSMLFNNSSNNSNHSPFLMSHQSACLTSYKSTSVDFSHRSMLSQDDGEVSTSVVVASAVAAASVNHPTTAVNGMMLSTNIITSADTNSITTPRHNHHYHHPIFNKLPQEYIVDFYDAFSAVNEGGVGLMIEYMDGGSLQDIVDAGGCDDEDSLAAIAKQALTGLQFLHDKAHLHRDLKPANFLISKRGEVKVGDFGILREMSSSSSSQSKEIRKRDVDSAAAVVVINDDGDDDKSSSPCRSSPSQTQASSPDKTTRLNDENKAESKGTCHDDDNDHHHDAHKPACKGVNDDEEEKEQLEREISHRMHRASTFVGTATYMSPERIEGKEYGYPSDIWAFGLSLMTVALGKLSIQTDAGYWGILQSIRDDAAPSIPESDTRFSMVFRDFLSRCLQKNPDDRYTCKELLRHSFITSRLEFMLDDINSVHNNNHHHNSNTSTNHSIIHHNLTDDDDDDAIHGGECKQDHHTNNVHTNDEKIRNFTTSFGDPNHHSNNYNNNTNSAVYYTNDHYNDIDYDEESTQSGVSELYEIVNALYQHLDRMKQRQRMQRALGMNNTHHSSNNNHNNNNHVNSKMGPGSENDVNNSSNMNGSISISARVLSARLTRGEVAVVTPVPAGTHNSGNNNAIITTTTTDAKYNDDMSHTQKPLHGNNHDDNNDNNNNNSNNNADDMKAFKTAFFGDIDHMELSSAVQRMLLGCDIDATEVNHLLQQAEPCIQRFHSITSIFNNSNGNKDNQNIQPSASSSSSSSSSSSVSYAIDSATGPSAPSRMSSKTDIKERFTRRFSKSASNKGGGGSGGGSSTANNSRDVSASNSVSNSVKSSPRGGEDQESKNECKEGGDVFPTYPLPSSSSSSSSSQVESSPIMLKNTSSTDCLEAMMMTKHHRVEKDSSSSGSSESKMCNDDDDDNRVKVIENMIDGNCSSSNHNHHHVSNSSSIVPKASSSFLHNDDDLTDCFRSAIWDTPLMTIQHLAYQLHITNEEAVLVVLVSCRELFLNNQQQQQQQQQSHRSDGNNNDDNNDTSHYAMELYTPVAHHDRK